LQEPYRELPFFVSCRTESRDQNPAKESSFPGQPLNQHLVQFGELIADQSLRGFVADGMEPEAFEAGLGDGPGGGEVIC